MNEHRFSVNAIGKYRVKNVRNSPFERKILLPYFKYGAKWIQFFYLERNENFNDWAIFKSHHGCYALNGPQLCLNFFWRIFRTVGFFASDLLRVSLDVVLFEYWSRRYSILRQHLMTFLLDISNITVERLNCNFMCSPVVVLISAVHYIYSCSLQLNACTAKHWIGEHVQLRIAFTWINHH